MVEFLSLFFSSGSSFSSSEAPVLVDIAAKDVLIQIGTILHNLNKLLNASLIPMYINVFTFATPSILYKFPII